MNSFPRFMPFVCCLTLLVGGCEFAGSSLIESENEAAAPHISPAGHGTAESSLSPRELNKLLAEARAATAKYQRLEAATADGYMDLTEGHCVAHPELGGMGIHYINPGYFSLDLDHTQPQALVYEPQRNGRLRLVAIEFLVPKADWDAEHVDPPSLFGVEFPEAPHVGPPPGSYALHVWIWRHNPGGMFADFNPHVTCPAE